MERSTILEVRELKKFFPIGKKYLHAVDGVSFTGVLLYCPPLPRV